MPSSSSIYQNPDLYPVQSTEYDSEKPASIQMLEKGLFKKFELKDEEASPHKINTPAHDFQGIPSTAQQSL